jgi:hypothetical protein
MGIDGGDPAMLSEGITALRASAAEQFLDP